MLRRSVLRTAMSAMGSVVVGSHASAQRWGRSNHRDPASLAGSHFQVRYDRVRLSDGAAREALRLCESAHTACRIRFGIEGPDQVLVDLSPDFEGATGFASLAEPGSRDPDRRLPRIGVRFSELDYLGLDPEYVLTHEVSHVFSGPLASSALGEGIADWGARSFAGLPMREGWAQVLRSAGLWIDPEAFFLTGEFASSAEVTAASRTARYAEAGLLVHRLVTQFGWERTRIFAAEYGRLRGPLESNADRRQPARPPRGGSAVKTPDPDGIRLLFREGLGVDWNDFLPAWMRSAAADRLPEADSTRLSLTHQLYGAVRNYEMWLVEQRRRPADRVQELIRASFRRANASVARGEFVEGGKQLAECRSMVERLKRPAIVL